MFLVFLFLIGLVFGSFIAALSYRYPKKISNFKGRSFCDNCKHQINWYDNIPLLSFLILKGKSRCCDKKISLRYPIIEFTTAIGFLLIGLNIYYLILFCILEVIFIIDFEHKIIPDELIFVGIGSFLLMANNYSLITVLFSGFLCATLLLLIHLLTLGRGMGLGDVKFAVLGGMLVGLKLSLIWLFLAFLTGAFIGIILILGKVARLKDRIAFGPFLVVAIPITLIWGEKIIQLLRLSN